MAGPRRVFFGFVAIAGYWWCALRLLFWAFPVFVDGSGMMVSFYWGTSAPSTFPEIRYAYFVAASILTVLGCGTVWLVRLPQTGPLKTFLISWAATFFVFCSAVAVSDAGTRYHIWKGPTAFGSSETPFSYPQFLAVIVPLSLVAALLALVLNRVLRVGNVARF